MKFVSHKELNEKREFALLPHDDYELIIADLKKETRDKYNAKPDKEGRIPQEEVINFTMEVSGLRDGGEAFDEEDGSATERKVFFTGRPESMGFQQDGTPSKTRCLVAYATNQDVEGELELEEWETLLGRTIYAEIIAYTNQKGVKRNKISRFILPKKKTNLMKEVEDDEIPVIEE